MFSRWGVHNSINASMSSQVEPHCFAAQQTHVLPSMELNLLTNSERLLATFHLAGGWTLESAQAVCNRDGIEGEAVELMSQLVKNR
jgi:hypothetical protein